MSRRIVNFSAGPAVLPLEVLQQASQDLVDYKGAGLSVMEMSHRSKEYDEIHSSTKATIRQLMGISDDYVVLFLQGGASLQFSMVPMNLMQPKRRADYVVTGSWSKKAVKEARREGEVHVAASSEETGFDHIPESFDFSGDSDYVHITTNNTIYGTQWSREPDTGASPLVADMSSDIMCRPIDVSRYGLIYAGAQKNLGPAGVTVVILRRDLLDRAPDTIPTMLRYKTHADKDSLYNTPPTWTIYMVGLVADWVRSRGGLAAMEVANREKSQLLYDAIDAGEFYRGTVRPESRSMMNIPFRLPSEDLEKAFIEQARQAGMTNLKGHRSVGGVRASLYNAMPREGVETLVAFMKEFEKANG